MCLLIIFVYFDRNSDICLGKNYGIRDWRLIQKKQL
jgi:hypothetical protein